jgi:glycosyltransferase involved in cell wall biosynthesis
MKLDYIHSANVEVPSANAIQVSRMCEAFTNAGADTTLWYPRYASAEARPDWRAHWGVTTPFEARPVPMPLTERLFRSPALPALKLVGYTRLLAGYRSRTPDVIYTRCFAAAGFFPKARTMLARRPLVIFEAHEFPPSRARGRALRGVDAIVAITRAAADEICDQLAFPRARMLIAHDGVPASWLASPIVRDRARARPLAVYTGRFQPGTAEMLGAIATHLRDRVDILAVGMGAAEARARVGAVAGLTILDPVGSEDVRKYQAAADVLLMPHTGEVRWARYTSPLKLFEYMAAARPIVASHLPVLDEVLRHDDNAWLVPVGDAGAMAEGITRILADGARAARLVARAREDVGHYTWDARARRILELAREIAI